MSNNDVRIEYDFLLDKERAGLFSKSRKLSRSTKPR